MSRLIGERPTSTPVLGEIRRAKHIWLGRIYHAQSGYNKFMWASCPICGKTRWVQVRKAPFGRCADCANKAARGRALSGRKQQYRTEAGYILLHRPQYHRANSHGYVMEHIYIWESVHNRPLPKGYLIHHLNGVKDDNRPENLIAMKKGEHIHQTEPFKQRIRVLEAHIKVIENALKSNQLIYRLEEN